MKKFLLSILCLFSLVGFATAEEAVFNFTAPVELTPSITDDMFNTTDTEGAYDFAISETTFTSNGVTLNTTNGSTASRIWKAASGKYDLRLYKTATMTITAPAGGTITSIAFTGGTVNSFSADNGTVDGKNWTGSASKVVFTWSGSAKTQKINDITVTYTAAAAAVATPTFSVEAGTQYNPFSVEIAAEEGATVYYTLDGTEPTEESTEYTEAIAINKFGTTVTVKAAAVVEGEWSNVASATYSLKVAAPEFSIKGGVYEKLTGANALQFTTETEGATIHYNNRGGNPIEAGSKSYGSLSVLSTAEVKAVAFVEVDGEKIYSDVTSEKYYISPVKPFEKVTEFAAGEYLIHANGFAATALSETGNYGYLPQFAVEANGNFIETNAFYAFTFTEVEGGYTIQDTFGRYVYQTGTYNSFNVAAEMPETGAVWTVAIDETTGEATITNTSVNKYIQYSANYTSYGSYSDVKGVKPSLYKLGEYPTLTVTPANWETIPCFDKVTITCESGIKYNETDDVYPYYNIGWDYTPYEFDNVNVIDENTIELSFNTPIEDNGDYKVVLPAGLFILDPNGLAISSEEATANYTVENPNILEVIYANPDNGNKVKSIEYLYFEFNQDIFDNVNGAVITDEAGNEFPLTATYTDSWGDATPYNALCLKTAEPITTPGVYTFILKKEYIYAGTDTRMKNDLTYTFTITEGLKIVSVSPVAGAEVSAIDEIIIECNQDVQCWAEGFLVMDENKTEYFFAPTFTDKDGNELPYNMIRLVTETPITAAGKYTLYVEEYNIANTDWMNQEVLPAQTFVFEFDGSKITTGIDEVKGENGEVKTIFDLTGRKVKEITAPGIYIVNGKKILVK